MSSEQILVLSIWHNLRYLLSNEITNALRITPVWLDWQRDNFTDPVICGNSADAQIMNSAEWC